MSSRNLGLILALIIAIGLAIGWFCYPLSALQRVLVYDPIIRSKAQQAAVQSDAYTLDTTKGPLYRNNSSFPSPPRLIIHPAGTTCSMPYADDGETVVLFGTYEGAAVSSVSLEGMGQESRVTDIGIEQGTSPLYLILSSYVPTIWRFSGDVARVSKLVLLARGAPGTREAPVGAIGISAERITTNPLGSCFGEFSDPTSLEAIEASGVVQSHIGRKPDVIAGWYSAYRLRLPSGMGMKADIDRFDAPSAFDKSLWTEALRFAPGGLTQVDPKEVVGTDHAVAYDVLPNELGLSQLVGSGSLTRVSGAFKIVRPIERFPAALTGSHSTTFVLGTGMPMPLGSPGGSCVINEDTGTPIGVGTCR